MWNALLHEIKIAGRNVNNISYTDDTILMAESEEELKNLLIRMQEESEKASLKLNIQNTMIMASCSIISCHINGEKKKSEIQKYCSAFVFQGVTTEWAPSPKQWEWHPQLHPQNYT